MLRWVPACMLIVLLAATLLTTPTARAQTTWYVDDDADPNGDGMSWASPFQDLQDAFDVAIAGDEIRVAGGTYVPSERTDPNDPRAATFEVVNGAQFYGGYAGLADANNPDDRDIELYEAILSGDLNGDDEPPFGNYADNAYHVVMASGTDVTTLLDGFTITGGNAVTGDTPNHHGAGIYNAAGDLRINSCTFTRNKALGGAGMFNSAANPTLLDCTFVENRSRSGEIDAGGGGMLNTDDSDPVLERCTFRANRARTTGAGIFNLYDSDPTLSECTFIENVQTGGTVVIGSGAIDNSWSSPTLTSCTFIGNTASDWGGAVGNWLESNPVFTSCTFIQNSAERGGGMFNFIDSSPTLIDCTFSENAADSAGGGMHNENNCSPTITNCILWGDTPQEIYVHSGTPVVTHCDVQGGWTGTGNIDADPLFVDPDGPDGDPNTWEDNDYRLGLRSPCIDAGDNTAVPPDSTDLDGDSDTDEPIPVDLDRRLRFADLLSALDTGNPPGGGPFVDMGAYESQCDGDLNGDGEIDLNDLAELIGRYGITSGANYADGDLDLDADVDLDDLAELIGEYGNACIDCPGDLNADGVVDLSDLAQLAGHYGTASGATYTDGDLDLDGDVDLDDLAALLGVYGTTCE